MPFRLTAAALLSLALLLPVAATANFPVDPGIADLSVTRLDDASARVAWKTALPVTGGVLLYSKQHQFAVGLDPFTLRVVQETGEAALVHGTVVRDLDASDEWRFMVSYQPSEKCKYDSPLLYPFRTGTTEAAAATAPTPAAPPAAPAGR